MLENLEQYRILKGLKKFMDKFPEAFKRFEKSHQNIKDMRFNDIVRSFAEWQSEHVPYMTGKQIDALARIIENPIGVFWNKVEINYRWGKSIRYRSKRTGRFVKPR
jgi:hypothetical protein